MILASDCGIGIKVVLGKDAIKGKIIDYPVVCETLERIGIINRKEKKIFPSCYIVKTSETVPDPDNPNIYVVAHFKELFKIQGKDSTFSDDDKIRLKTICYLLQDWGLVKVLDKNDLDQILHSKVSVLPFKDKKQYEVVHKFKMVLGNQKGK
jgi:hypothetical protein